MKIRNGFVSNSSSTSFCLYGIYVPSGYDRLRDKADKSRLGTHSDQEGDGIYIGLHPSSIKDDETGAQFKRRATEALEALTGKKVVCGWHQDGWYNG